MRKQTCQKKVCAYHPDLLPFLHAHILQSSHLHPVRSRACLDQAASGCCLL